MKTRDGSGSAGTAVASAAEGRRLRLRGRGLDRGGFRGGLDGGGRRNGRGLDRGSGQGGEKRGGAGSRRFRLGRGLQQADGPRALNRTGEGRRRRCAAERARRIGEGSGRGLDGRRIVGRGRGLAQRRHHDERHRGGAEPEAGEKQPGRPEAGPVARRRRRARRPDVGSRQGQAKRRLVDGNGARWRLVTAAAARRRVVNCDCAAARRLVGGAATRQRFGAAGARLLEPLLESERIQKFCKRRLGRCRSTGASCQLPVLCHRSPFSGPFPGRSRRHPIPVAPPGMDNAV